MLPTASTSTASFFFTASSSSGALARMHSACAWRERGLASLGVLWLAPLAAPAHSARETWRHHSKVMPIRAQLMAACFAMCDTPSVCHRHPRTEGSHAPVSGRFTMRKSHVLVCLRLSSSFLPCSTHPPPHTHLLPCGAAPLLWQGMKASRPQVLTACSSPDDNSKQRACGPPTALVALACIAALAQKTPSLGEHQGLQAQIRTTARRQQLGPSS